MQKKRASDETEKNFVDEYGYELSENQQKFVEDALAQGHEVTYDYSGRGMYGRMCPSITVEGMGGVRD